MNCAYFFIVKSLFRIFKISSQKEYLQNSHLSIQLLILKKFKKVYGLSRISILTPNIWGFVSSLFTAVRNEMHQTSLEWSCIEQNLLSSHCLPQPGLRDRALPFIH